MKKLTVIKFTLLAIFAGLFLTASIQAATFTVDRTDDATISTCGAATANDCTLRGAIAAANATTVADVVEFDATVFNTPQTITLGGTELSITRTLTINGTGADKLTVSGNNGRRVILINSTANVTINGITITGGNGSSTTFNGLGGGIFVNPATLTLNNVVVRGNSTSTGSGAGIYINSGTIRMNNSTVSGNTGAQAGGGVFNFRGNLTVNNSTFSSNQASDGGGGIFVFGGITSINSTTLSNNTSASGGGFFMFGDTNGTTTFRNSLIANSTSGGDCFRDGGTVNATYSLIEENLTCINGTNSNNLTGDPNLGALTDNGGPTKTHALPEGSKAIDAGSIALIPTDANNAPFIYDQRGPNFLRLVGSSVDIGSFEVQILDGDGDGINDDIDNCPNDANADQADNDLDMIGDVCDDDDDNDGVLDGDDAFPFDPTESVDTDGDGIGNNADTDDDNDGQLDTDEMACGSDPLDAASKSPDADGDNSPDCVDSDDDNDDIPDVCDIDQNPGAEDFDRDGIVDGSGCDTEIGPPTDKDQCKDDGYLRFNAPTFRNQGQCVSYVNGRRP